MAAHVARLPLRQAEVEVQFLPEGPEKTRVVLEHRKLERFGDKAEMMRAMFDSPDAWQGTLGALARAAEQGATRSAAARSPASAS